MVTLVSKHDDFDVARVTVPYLDSSSSRAFRSSVGGIVKPGRALVLGLSQVRFADSSGIAALLATARSFREAGGRLLLAGATPEVRSLLELTRLYLIIDVTSSEAEAIRLAGSGFTAN